MRHGAQPALRHALEGLAGLEGEAVARDGDFMGRAGAGVDVEACGRVGGVEEFGEGRERGGGGGGGGEMGGEGRG